MHKVRQDMVMADPPWSKLSRAGELNASLHERPNDAVHGDDASAAILPDDFILSAADFSGIAVARRDAVRASVAFDQIARPPIG